jgi:hypothetical protein
MAQRIWPCESFREKYKCPLDAREKPEISPRTATGLNLASSASAIARHSAPTCQIRGANTGLDGSAISKIAPSGRIGSEISPQRRNVETFVHRFLADADSVEQAIDFIEYFPAQIVIDLSH